MLIIIVLMMPISVMEEKSFCSVIIYFNTKCVRLRTFFVKKKIRNVRASHMIIIYKLY